MIFIAISYLGIYIFIKNNDICQIGYKFIEYICNGKRKLIMTDLEKKKFSKAIKEYKLDVLKSKDSSQKFLRELGIITKSGKLAKNYKNLCIPLERG